MRKQENIETYNGWSNYPTWAVYNWLSNDSATYTAMQDVGRSAISAFAAGQTIRQLVEDFNPFKEQASMYLDLLTWALAKVNWEEIGNAYYRVTHDQTTGTEQ